MKPLTIEDISHVLLHGDKLQKDQILRAVSEYEGNKKLIDILRRDAAKCFHELREEVQITKALAKAAKAALPEVKNTLTQVKLIAALDLAEGGN